MICYRDRTYCPFDGECEDGPDCTSALTDYVRDEAARIGVGISQYSEKPEYFKEA